MLGIFPHKLQFLTKSPSLTQELVIWLSVFNSMHRHLKLVCGIITNDIRETCQFLKTTRVVCNFHNNLSTPFWRYTISFYNINTNEIPSELSRENLISSHVKITCYLHMWKYHRCYGFIINRTFQTKKLFK